MTDKWRRGGMLGVTQHEVDAIRRSSTKHIM